MSTPFPRGLELGRNPFAFGNLSVGSPFFPNPKHLSLGVSEPIKDLLRKASEQPLPDEEDILQKMQVGDIPCGWTEQSVWENVKAEVQNFITKRDTQEEIIKQLESSQDEQTTRIKIIQAQIAALQLEEAKVTKKLQSLKSEIQEERKHWNEDKEWSGENMLSFTQTACKVEQQLIHELEEQLQVGETLPHRAPQGKPTLSTLLNCFQVKSDTIVLVNLMQLDSDEFLVTTRGDFYRNNCRAPHLFDVLYCQEMLNNAPFPFSDHIDYCPVCGCETTTQLLFYLTECKIELDEAFLKENRINGPRALTLDADLDFGNHFEVNKISKSLRKLRTIHKNAFRTQMQETQGMSLSTLAFE